MNTVLNPFVQKANPFTTKKENHKKLDKALLQDLEAKYLKTKEREDLNYCLPKLEGALAKDVSKKGNMNFELLA